MGNIKLHLGCGQKYLKGYTNIDFPLSEHTVQAESPADIHADILALRYPAGSIAEVRLHHLFEHFKRPVACGLVASWYSWLEPAGRIHIEVPDLAATAKRISSFLTTFRRRAVAERHIFGSHEAPWAVHYEGYTGKTLGKLLDYYGFRVEKTRENRWKGTYNVEVFARKEGTDITREKFFRITEKYLSNFLVDRSKGERQLLSIWLDMYEEQVGRTWAEGL